LRPESNVVPVQTFIEKVDLKVIRNIERVGKLHRIREDDERPSNLDVDFKLFEWGQYIELGFGLSTAEEGGSLEISVKVHVIYSNPEELNLSKEDKEIFLSDVVFMQVYPYLREGFSSMAQQLGVGIPTLGVLERGQYRIELDGTESGSF